MKAIIYCRKSTDRGDRQQLSIEAQEKEALLIAKREGFEVVKIFKETQSAKDPGRPQFNQMLKLLNSNKADIIITWKLNRLARNAIDEGAIKHSLQHGIIKAIYTPSEVFRTGDNVLIMGMHFGMSTQYILDLQADIKRGMKQKIANGGVCQKAPLGYINNRLEKTIEVDPVKSKWVKEIFTLRSQHVSCSTISKILFEKGIKRDNGSAFPKVSIEGTLKNKFYIGLVKHNGEYYKGNYKTFISKALFDKVQNLGQGISYRTTPLHELNLKGFLKDEKGRLLSGYITKGYSYYKSSSQDIKKVNISENKIFKHFEKELESFRADENFKALNKEIIYKIFEAQKPDEFATINQINHKIKKLSDKKESLLDLRLEGEIDKQIYLEKSNNIVLQIQNLENDKKDIQNNNIEEKLKLILELNENLYTSYKLANNQKRSLILKNLFLELFVNSKKELSYAENSLYNCLKMLNFNQNSKMEVPTRFELV